MHLQVQIFPSNSLKTLLVHMLQSQIWDQTCRLLRLIGQYLTGAGVGYRLLHLMGQYLTGVGYRLLRLIGQYLTGVGYVFRLSKSETGTQVKFEPKLKEKFDHVNHVQIVETIIYICRDSFSFYWTAKFIQSRDWNYQILL